MSGSQDVYWSQSLVETMAGFSAGIASTLCLHPLDLIKTRLQGKFKTIIQSYNSVLSTNLTRLSRPILSLANRQLNPRDPRNIPP